tara:strand:- start:31325 stop:31789 length:465 start_codon:yes stop_codon:yes gene_type:complete
MWYLILCFTLFLFLSKNTFTNKFISLSFLTYLLSLELLPSISLEGYVLWTTYLLGIFIWCSYKDYNIMYIPDTVVISILKVLELSLLFFPELQFYLPEMISDKIFILDGVFLSAVITSLILRDTGYTLKVNMGNIKEYYLLISVVVLHVIAYVF